MLDGYQVEEALWKMVERLMNEEQKPEEIQACPQCNGRLHVRFEVYGRKFGAQIWCENCYVKMAIDYIDVFPKWA